MSHPLRRVLIVLAAGVLTLNALYADTGRRRSTSSPASPAPAGQKFVASELEYYLTDDGVAYIRPGLKIQVNSIVIGSDRKPVVELTLTDNMNQPLDRLGQTTPGPISLSFILASYDPDTREFTAYTVRTQNASPASPGAGHSAVQAGTDSGGTFTDLSTGRVKYTFRTVLPAGFDQAKTHTLGIYSVRNLNDFILNKRYIANVEHDFRPDGGTVTAKWDKIRDASSCLNCHDPLGLHGGSRQDVKLCVMCHSTQTVDPDTGNSVNMAEMTHRIHAPGRQTTPYIIWGNQSSVHNYSEVTYPQDVRNCDNCHEGTATTKPSQADVYLTRPSRRACGACHPNVNFATGAGHGGGVPPQTDDSRCATCHIPDSGSEFDTSIKGAHTIPEKSKQLKGLTSTIVSTADVAAGMKPTVTFAIKNGDGTAVDGTKLNTFAPILAGPTSSYTKYYRENALTAGKFDAATGLTSYTFTNAIPADAKGTWTFSADIYRNATLKRADGEADMTLREAAYNPLKYVAVTGAVQPRRTVVTDAQCNACHDRLALHGGQRLVIAECVICHNPEESDVSRRPANAGPPESISMQRMIHRIHTGLNLTQEYSVFGFGGTAIHFNEVTYPGDRRNCAACHTGTSDQVPPPPGAGAVTTLRDYFTKQGPGTAACLGCHDNRDAAAHAYLNTTAFPGSTDPAESCGVCHGTNAEWAVDKVHAR